MDKKLNSCNDFIYFYYTTWGFFSVSKNGAVKESGNTKVLLLYKSSCRKKIKLLDGVLSTFLDTRLGIKYIKDRGNGYKREEELGPYLFFISAWYVFCFRNAKKINSGNKKVFL